MKLNTEPETDRETLDLALPQHIHLTVQESVITLQALQSFLDGMNCIKVVRIYSLVRKNWNLLLKLEWKRQQFS